MPEVTLKDSFGKAMDRTIRDYRFQSCLELGSFDGDGSTQVIIQALAAGRNPRLVCIEADPERFKNLVANTSGFPWVRNVCASTISRSSFTLSDFDRDVWNSPHNHLEFPYEQVKGWWNEGLEFLESAGDGFLDTSSEAFDVVLIDGGEFCGYDEFRLVKDRSQCLLLDDVFKAYKNSRVHAELLSDPHWKLVWEDRMVRHGASIFVRSHLRPSLAARLRGIFRR
jgi:hypothetical protein